jgi:multidrug resistance efflux pump
MTATDSAVQPEVHHWRPPPLRVGVLVMIALLALAAIVGILYAFSLWPFDGVEVTDDAFVRGRTTVIAPQVSGYVVQVAVGDYANVKRGEVLARIDDSTYRARVDQAEAALQVAEATLANSRQASATAVANSLGDNASLTRARADMTRADALVKVGSISVSSRDQTRAALAQAVAQAEVARQTIRSIEVGRNGLVAQVAAARAALKAALIDLDHTVIRAPEVGQISEVGVRLGQYVTNGTQLMSLVPSERWVIANYKEAQTANLQAGAAATFTVDALGGALLRGHIEQLSPAAGSEFSVLRPDNATGNFVKVPQRIGVRISIDPGQAMFARLRPGMSVTVHVNIGDAK